MTTPTTETKSAPVQPKETPTQPVEMKEPEHIDYWHPTVNQVKGKSTEEKLLLIDACIDKASSDTQFAAKLKAAIKYILIDVENMPGELPAQPGSVDAPGAQTVKPYEGTKTAEQLKAEEEAKRKALTSPPVVTPTTPPVKK